MRVSPIVKDRRELIKLLKACTNLKCFDTFFSINPEGYSSITTEYKDRTFPHITVAQGSWNIQDGGEYKLSIYLPCMTVGLTKKFNHHLFQSYLDKIMDALNERFGEDHWNACNVTCTNWRPLSRCSYYIQIPNFEKY